MADAIVWLPCSECPNPKFCKRHGISGCQRPPAPASSDGSSRSADLIARLRDSRYGAVPSQRAEAADEIERLRALLDTAKDVRFATILDCRDAALKAYSRIATGQYVLTGPAGIASAMLNAIDGLALSNISEVLQPKDV